MRHLLAACALCILPTVVSASDVLARWVWIHGAKDCASNTDPAIEVLKFDADTYILRQNRCVHPEAPFVFVLFGEQTVLVQDTGATADPNRFPLFDTVLSLIERRGRGTPQILVVHSHSHSDHTAADAQFRGQAGVTLVEPNRAAVREFFGVAQWPAGSATIDLGQRVVHVIPVPGHQEESIALYDAKTGWLLTGDTVYPGRVMVKDWSAYRSSIDRLVEFAKAHRVSVVLGSHIEMSASGMLFAPGNTYQPGEAPLPLGVEDLDALHQGLRQAGAEAKEVVTPKVVVTPLGSAQRALGAALKWLGVR
jgi:glyoxylase-like metal-dependent hydrolase (beta-lactamase superfamily II)